MCNKSSCIQCHSKSHCQEFSKNKQIAKLERTIEHLNRRIEDEKLENNQVIDELLSEIKELKESLEIEIRERTLETQELAKSEQCLLLQLEKYGKMVAEADERIEKMKNTGNCGSKHYITTDYGPDACCHECNTCPCENWELV